MLRRFDVAGSEFAAGPLGGLPVSDTVFSWEKNNWTVGPSLPSGAKWGKVFTFRLGADPKGLQVYVCLYTSISTYIYINILEFWLAYMYIRILYTCQKLMCTRNSKQAVLFGCFNGMIPNDNMKNVCFTKGQFKLLVWGSFMICFSGEKSGG